MTVPSLLHSSDGAGARMLPLIAGIRGSRPRRFLSVGLGGILTVIVRRDAARLFTLLGELLRR
jgi:hypothetical protein